MTRLAVALPFVLALGCADPGTLVVAAEGGEVESPDGRLTLVFPPGALAADATIHVRALSEDAWPVGAPGRFALLAPVYEIRPTGLGLPGDAYAILRLDEPPDALVSDAGAPVLAASYVYGSDAKVRPAPQTRTVMLADGRVAVISTLYELGVHWFGERVPGPDRSLVQLSARIETAAAPPGAELEWRWSDGAILADAPHTLVGRTASAMTAGAGALVEPVAVAGATAWDGDLPPWTIFADTVGGRVAVASDPTPIGIGPDAPTPMAETLPGWRCVEGAGGTLWAGVDVVTGASEGTVTVGLAREIGAARCP